MTRLSKYTDKEIMKLAYTIEDMLSFGGVLQNKWKLSKEQLIEMETEVAQEMETRNITPIKYIK